MIITGHQEMGAAKMDRRSEHQDIRTAGELRHRLQELGNPWIVNPSLSDDDMLPAYSRGGQVHEDIPDDARIHPSNLDEIRALLRISEPANIHLRERWVEEGLMQVNRAPHQNVKDRRDESDDAG
jgi:hypothetical protein